MKDTITTGRKMYAFSDPKGYVDRDTVLCEVCFELAGNRLQVYGRVRSKWLVPIDDPERLTSYKQTFEDITSVKLDNTGTLVSCTNCNYHNENQTIPCEMCGTPTSMLGTKLCDPCWEKQRHVTIKPLAVVVEGVSSNERRAMPGKYTLLDLGQNTYRLYWTAQGEEFSDEPDVVCDIDNTVPESMQNIVSILNEGLALMVEKDNKPQIPAVVYWDEDKEEMRDEQGAVLTHTMLNFIRAFGTQWLDAQVSDAKDMFSAEQEALKAAQNIPYKSASSRYNFRPVVKPRDIRPFGIELYDVFSDANPVWNIWMFTEHDRDAQLALFQKDPLGYVRTINEFNAEMEED